MAVFLIVLKVILIILLSAIGLLLLLLFLPTMAIVDYREGQVSVKLRVLYFIKLKLPLSGKKKTAKPKAADQPESEAKSDKKKPQLDFELIKKLLPPGGRLIKKICSAISITQIDVFFPVHDANPAKTALSYGRAWAAYGIIYPLIANTFRTTVKNIEIFADYNNEAKNNESVVFEVHAILGLMVVASVSFLINYLKIKQPDREEQNGKRNR